MYGVCVRGGNAERTTSKSGHHCPCQNCSQRPPAEKTGRGSLLNRPSFPPDDPISQGLNWTELNKMALFASLCHTRHHTRWQCLPLCVILDIIQDGCVCLCVILFIQDGSVCLSVSYSASGKMAVLIIMPLCTTLNMAMSASLFHIQSHAKWQYLPLCVAPTIIQDSFFSLSLTSPDITLCGGLGAKHQLTNWLASLWQFQHHVPIGCNLQASTFFCFALKKNCTELHIIFNFLNVQGSEYFAFNLTPRFHISMISLIK